MEVNAYEYRGWVAIALILFVGLNLAIGAWVSQRISGLDDYLAAGRKVGLFLGAGTMFATWFGVSTPIGYAGNAYVYGNQGLIADPWGAILFLILLGTLFAVPLRRSKYITAVDLFESRYGRGVALFSTVFLAASDTGWLASMLVAGGSIVEFFTGIPLVLGIAIATTILTVYTMLGGIWAVTLTDAIQSVLCIVGVVAVLWVMVPLVGWDAVFAEEATHNLSGFEHWAFLPTSDPDPDKSGFLGYQGTTGWLYWLACWLPIGIGSLPTQSVFQRLVGMKSERTARYAILLAAGLFSLFGVIPVFIGTIYHILNPNLSIDDAFTKIPLIVIVEYLPSWLGVFFVVAIVAALMSSADSVVLAVASLLGFSGYKLLKPDATDEQLLRATRAVVPAIAIFALVIALGLTAIYQLMVFSGTIVLVSLCAPMIAGLFWPRANRWGAYAGIIGGTLSWGVSFLRYLPMTIAANGGELEGARWDAAYIASLWGFLASIALLVIVSLLTQRQDKPRPMLDADGRPLFSSAKVPSEL